MKSGPSSAESKFERVKRFEQLLAGIMQERSLTRSEARRWLAEEIDRIRRVQQVQRRQERLSASTVVKNHVQILDKTETGKSQRTNVHLHNPLYRVHAVHPDAPLPQNKEDREISLRQRGLPLDEVGQGLNRQIHKKPRSEKVKLILASLEKHEGQNNLVIEELSNHPLFPDPVILGKRISMLKTQYFRGRWPDGRATWAARRERAKREARNGSKPA